MESHLLCSVRPQVTLLPTAPRINARLGLLMWLLPFDALALEVSHAGRGLSDLWRTRQKTKYLRADRFCVSVLS